VRSVVQSAVSQYSKLRGTAFTLPFSASTAAGLTTMVEEVQEEAGPLVYLRCRRRYVRCKAMTVAIEPANQARACLPTSLAAADIGQAFR
jgi:hypothetical protein